MLSSGAMSSATVSRVSSSDVVPGTQYGERGGGNDAADITDAGDAAAAADASAVDDEDEDEVSAVFVIIPRFPTRMSCLCLHLP